MREREQEAVDFGGEWMMLPIASRVQPQDLPCRSGSRERVQHRQNGRRPDSRAEQHDRALSRLQDEAPARRADVEGITQSNVVAEIAPAAPFGSIFTLIR